MVCGCWATCWIEFSNINHWCQKCFNEILKHVMLWKPWDMTLNYTLGNPDSEVGEDEVKWRKIQTFHVGAHDKSESEGSNKACWVWQATEGEQNFSSIFGQQYVIWRKFPSPIQSQHTNWCELFKNTAVEMFKWTHVEEMVSWHLRMVFHGYTSRDMFRWQRYWSWMASASSSASLTSSSASP